MNSVIRRNEWVMDEAIRQVSRQENSTLIKQEESEIAGRKYLI